MTNDEQNEKIELDKKAAALSNFISEYTRGNRPQLGAIADGLRCVGLWPFAEILGALIAAFAGVE